MRRGELERRGLVEPSPAAPTTAQLIEKATTITAPIAAVEALWDGDTQGWFVRLVAMVRRPGPDHDRFDEVLLTLMRDGGDVRLFNGHVPPWPEERRATEQGQALAQHLGVPFHFTSPGMPGHRPSTLVGHPARLTSTEIAAIGARVHAHWLESDVGGAVVAASLPENMGAAKDGMAGHALNSRVPGHLSHTRLAANRSLSRS